MNRLLPFLIVLAAVAFVATSLRRERNQREFDLEAFGRLPTLVNGRIKPLDTVARTSLMVLQGRQNVRTLDGATMTPAEWLLDMMYRPVQANEYPVFEIVHPEVLSLTGLTVEEGAAGKRFSYRQLAPHLPDIDRQAKRTDDVEAAVRTPFQRAVVALRNHILLYQRLQLTAVDPSDPRSLDRLQQFQQELPEVLALLAARRAGEPVDLARAQIVAELSRTFATLEAFGYLLLIPPETRPHDAAGWISAGQSWRESLADGRLNPATRFYVELGLAWRDQEPARFNALLSEQREVLAAAIPQRLRKSDLEALFNRAQPFYTSTVLYVAAFLLAVFSWLRWPAALGSAAFALVGLAFVLSTIGIAIRMWLEGRPPVTNLYSSALFVGWGSVALCLLLEGRYRNAVGSVAAGVIGFCSLVIAHHLSLSGDTLEMMRAVLDSNFWLATHVVTIALGYSAMFLAGFLALIYVLRGVLTRSLDATTAANLSRMVYGVICFATFFSFVGTVIGGIWADQSWGRFWGWDPKENGALIIVLWCALVLHARWGGMVKARGLMVLAIFGNIVTAWSWFGVNMLGVGLHSYGFMDSAFWWLLIFGGSQLVVMGLGALPERWWRSESNRATNTAPASGVSTEAAELHPAGLA
jgi:ABC-type transport system involved in cytochrome c biogenesis permease subunit